MGFVIENFKWAGKIPGKKDILQISVNGEHTQVALIFNNLVEISL